MTQIVSASPFRCRMWDLHDRLDQFIDEETCRTEILSFSQEGQLIPVLGRPLSGDRDHDFELICGARRLFVARHLNMPLLVELRELTDRAAIIAMDIENRQRQDISPYERGLSFAKCLRAGYFASQDDLARALKISQSQVSRLLTLARLPSVIVGAFASPLEIREGWGQDLSAALKEDRRSPTIARARAITSSSSGLPAIEVYQQLIAASVSGRKPRARRCDEIVTSDNGAPLFRVRIQDKTIALLLPRDRTSADLLSAVRDAVRDVMQQKNGLTGPRHGEQQSHIKRDCRTSDVAADNSHARA